MGIVALPLFRQAHPHPSSISLLEGRAIPTVRGCYGSPSVSPCNMEPLSGTSSRQCSCVVPRILLSQRFQIVVE